MPKQLIDAATKVALGTSILLAWAFLLTLAGVACLALDGSVTIKVVALKVDSPLLTLWAAAAITPVLQRSKPATLVAAVLLTLSAVLGERVLAAATIIVTIAAAAISSRDLVTALALGAATFELLRIAYLLLSVYGVMLPGSEALEAVHYSLYAPLTWILPLLVLAACLAPAARLLFPDLIKPKGRSCKLPPAELTLPLSLSLSCFLWLLLYKSPLSTGRLVGVDAPVYLSFAERMLVEGYVSVMKDVFCDRPLFMLLLGALSNTIGSRTAVETMPLVCKTANALAAFVFSSAIGGRKLGGLAALLSTVTYTTTAGLFAGYYANWLALAVSQLAAAALTLWLRGRRIAHLIIATALASTCTAFHVHMGLVTAAALTAACVLTIIMKRDYTVAAAAALLLTAPLATTIAINQLQRSWGGSCAMLNVATGLVSQWGADREAIEAGLPLSERWWIALHLALYNWMFTAALDPTDWLLLTASALTAPLPQALVLLAWHLTSGLMTATAPDTILIHRALYSLPIVSAAAVGLVEFRKKEVLWTVFTFKISYILSYLIGIV